MYKERSVSSLGWRTYAWFAAFYVTYSGIYWLPGIPPVYLVVGKITIFVCLFLIGVLHSNLVRGKTNSLFLALILCSVLAFITNLRVGDMSLAIDRMRDFLEPAVWLLILSSIPERTRPLFVRALLFFLIGFLFFAIYPILASIGLTPDYRVPFVLGGDLHVDLANTVSTSGFGASRTGWGVTVAPAIMMFAVLLSGARNSLVFAVIPIVVSIGIVSIVLTGARGGSVALILSFAFLVMRRNALMAIGALVFASLASLLVPWEKIVPAFYLRRTNTHGSWSERLNDLTTGRLDTMVEGISTWLSSPLIGVGAGQAKVFTSGTEIEVHNVWIRLLAESGLLLLVPVVWILFLVFRSRFKSKGLSVSNNERTIGLPNSESVLICGILLSFVEPSVIFGSFGVNALFWTAVWFAHENCRYLSRKRFSMTDKISQPHIYLR